MVVKTVEITHPRASLSGAPGRDWTKGWTKQTRACWVCQWSVCLNSRPYSRNPVIVIAHVPTQEILTACSRHLQTVQVRMLRDVRLTTARTSTTLINARSHSIPCRTNLLPPTGMDLLRRCTHNSLKTGDKRTYTETYIDTDCACEPFVIVYRGVLRGYRGLDLQRRTAIDGGNVSPDGDQHHQRQ